MQNKPTPTHPHKFSEHLVVNFNSYYIGRLNIYERRQLLAHGLQLLLVKKQPCSKMLNNFQGVKKEGAGHEKNKRPKDSTAP